MNVKVIQTKADIAIVLRDLDSIDQWLFSDKSKTWQELKDKITPITLAFLDSDKSPSKTALKEARTQLDILPRADIVLAVYPDEKLIEALSSWARRYLHPDAVIAIAVNRSLVAGIQITWRGVFYDGSFVSEINGQHQS